MSSTLSAVRSLVVWTHGATDSANRKAAIAIHYDDSLYKDFNLCEEMVAPGDPHAAAFAGYWAIARALAHTPPMTSLRIKSEDETCIATLKLLLDHMEKTEQDWRTLSIDHDYSHKELVHRILQDVKGRKKLGCDTHFEFFDRHGMPTWRQTPAQWLDSGKGGREVELLVFKALHLRTPEKGASSLTPLSSASTSTIGSS